MHPTLTVAIKAARRAGAILSRASLDLAALKVEEKGPGDFVSDADRAAEAAIIEILQDAYPQHAILAEEKGQIGDSSWCWLVDPLDGTTNFLHGFPHFAVSIALAVEGKLSQAVVFQPVTGDLYVAGKGEGAFLNDRRLRVSKAERLERALVGTGFSKRKDKDLGGFMALLQEVTLATSGVRRAGAASLDLAYVAAGRLDGYFEFHLNAWDIAAGALLVQEAGGLVAEPREGKNFLVTGNIAAATPRLFAPLRALAAKGCGSSP